MGCAAPASIEKPGEGLITVYGDYFSPETRTILAILDISGLKYMLKHIDQFQKQHQHPDYLRINPTG